jgi:endonuclease III
MSERLIQEDFLEDPWKMLVCCILLNQTNNKQVRPILSSVFKLIPTPILASKCDCKSLALVIKTTGFHNIKSSRIKKMSEKWISGFNHPRELPGIGKYGLESWEIFVNRNYKISPSDKKLSAYLDFLELM